jgi:cysteine protease ATG4
LILSNSRSSAAIFFGVKANQSFQVRARIRSMTTDDTHSTVVLVTPPRCTTETPEGANLVEAPACQIVQVGRRFGAKDDGGDDGGGDDDDGGAATTELEERPISIVPSKIAEAPGGYDVCREYGYKYEYTQDYPDEQEDDDSSSANPLWNEPSMTQSTNNIRHALHQTTAVITKTQERIPYIHLLGKTYHPVHDYHVRKGYEASLFWFTYRCDFPEIAPYKITSDAGWGCMLRSAQMLLAHTLRIHFKSKHWKPPTAIAKCRNDDFVTSLLTWFADFPSKTESVYSLHNMVATGYAKYETLPGEWYGPGTACYVLRDLVKLHEQTQLSLFRVHVSSEGTVYRDAVHALMTQDSKQRAEERQRESEQATAAPLHPLDPSIPAPFSQEAEDLEWDTSLLLLVPLRLGLEKFNEDYADSVARSFWLPQSVGILGGRPRGARWFYGAYADGSKVLGLDPHTVQSAPQRRQQQQQQQSVDLSDDYMQSVHTTYPEVFPLTRMDPSLAIGFYCRDKKEFAALEASLQELKKQSSAPDLFTFADHSPDYLSSAMNEMMMLGSSELTEEGDHAEESDEDEYVLL